MVVCGGVVDLDFGDDGVIRFGYVYGFVDEFVEIVMDDAVGETRDVGEG